MRAKLWIMVVCIVALSYSAFADTRIGISGTDLIGYCDISYFNTSNFTYQTTWYANTSNVSYYSPQVFVSAQNPTSTNYEGNWMATQQAFKAYDSDTSTYASCNSPSNNCWIYANYSSLGSTNRFYLSANLTFKDGSGTFTIDLMAAPYNCDDPLRQAWKSEGGLHEHMKQTQFWCWRLGAYTEIFRTSSGTDKLYEDIYMNYTYVPIFNYTSETNIDNYTHSLNGTTFTLSCRQWNGTHYSAWANSTPIFSDQVTMLIYNEMNLSLMNLDGIQQVRADFFCDSSVVRQYLSSATESFNVSCDYNYVNVWFVYNTSTSYYRTFIPTDKSQVKAYMIDLFNTTSVLWDVKLIDLIGDYEGQPFFVTKLTQYNGTITVINQYPDIQNYVHLYLVKDESYILNIYDSSGRLRIIGNIEALEAAQKVATLPQITFKPDYYLGDDIAIDLDYLPKSGLFRLSYEDSAGLTTSTRIRVYNGTDNVLIDVLNTTSNTFTYSLAIIDNQSYLVDLTVCHSIIGCTIYDRRTYGIDIPSVPDFNWVFANGTNMTSAKKVAGAVIVGGTALLFPIRSVVAGIVLVLIELAILSRFGLLDFNVITYSVFFVILGMSAIRKVVQKR